jgi:hypothetical protein
VTDSDEIVAAYWALKNAGRINDVLRLEYRCHNTSACLLVAVFQIPGGVFGYVSSVTTTRGRERTTLIPEHGYDLNAPSDLVIAQCKHLHPQVFRPQAVAADLGQPGRPTRRRLAPGGVDASVIVRGT